MSSAVTTLPPSCLEENLQTGRCRSLRGLFVVSETLSGDGIEGFTKLSFVVQSILRFLSRMGVNGLEAATHYFGTAATLGSALDLFKRVQVLVLWQVNDWAQGISAIFWVAFRAIEMGRLLEKIKLINYGAITSTIGRIPFVGKVVMLPFEIIGAAACLFDIVHQVKRLNAVELEINERVKFAQCAKIKYDYFEYRDKHKVSQDADLKFETQYIKAESELIESRILLGRIAPMENNAIVQKANDAWNKFKNRINPDVETIRAGRKTTELEEEFIVRMSKLRATRDETKEKEESAEKEKERRYWNYIVTEKNRDMAYLALMHLKDTSRFLAQEAAKNGEIDTWSARLAIIADIARIVFLSLTAVGILTAIPALALTSSIILTLAVISWSLSLTHFFYDLANKKDLRGLSNAPETLQHFERTRTDIAQKLWADLGLEFSRA